MLRDGVVTTYLNPDHSTRVTGTNAGGATAVEATLGFVEPLDPFNMVSYPYVYPAGSEKSSPDPGMFRIHFRNKQQWVVAGYYETAYPPCRLASRYDTIMVR